MCASRSRDTARHRGRAAAAVTHADWDALAHRIEDELVGFTLIAGGGTLIGSVMVPFVAFPASGAWPCLIVSALVHIAYYVLLMRSHFPSEQAALKCVYMAIMSRDPTGRGHARWTMRWKTALNAFDITFDDLLSAARQKPQLPPVAPLV